MQYISYSYVFQMMEGKVKLGKVNCDNNYHICQSAGVRAYPTVKFYGGITSKTNSQVFTRVLC